jgi:hypothetical protein
MQHGLGDVIGLVGVGDIESQVSQQLEDDFENAMGSG